MILYKDKPKIQSLGQEDPLKKEVVQYSCMGNPWTEEPGGLRTSKRVRHDLVTEQQ